MTTLNKNFNLEYLQVPLYRLLFLRTTFSCKYDKDPVHQEKIVQVFYLTKLAKYNFLALKYAYK